MANLQANPTILHLAAELAAGRTTSRKLTEEAFARIEDPKGEGKRVFIKALQAAGDGRRRGERPAAQGGPRAVAARGTAGLDQEPLRRRRRDHAVGLQGARRCAACQGRRARRGAAACGRRGDRGQHQHERVRLLGRGLQPALRHARQSRRPQARARRLVGRCGRVRRRPDGGRGARHRHRRLRPHSLGRMRSRGLQAHGAAGADRWRDSALDLARLDRTLGQLGRMLRHRRCGVRCRADQRARCRAARGPSLRDPRTIRHGRARAGRRGRFRTRLQGACRPGRQDRAYRRCRN